MKKIMFVIVLTILFGCERSFERKLIDDIKDEYIIYGNLDKNIIKFSVEEIIFSNKKIYRISGWSEKKTVIPTNENFDEWILIICKNKNYKVIKHTAFRPLDSLGAYKEFNCDTIITSN